MTNRLEFEIIIYDNYKELLKKNIYEPIILKIMNLSSLILKEKYHYIENQSHNESDFVSDSGLLYDAKILFYENQCQALSINKDNLYTFITTLQAEINEIYDAIEKKDYNQFISSVFYREMKYRIKKAESKENIILFIPFACTKELSTNLSPTFNADIFTYLFQCFVKEEPSFSKTHDIYIIYPNLENYILFKKLNDNTREFVMKEVLTEYIKFKLK